MDSINSAILLTNDDLSYANVLKQALRENNYELIYTKQFEKLFDFSIASKHSLIFIDDCFSMYKSIFKFFLERSECFKNHVIIFIDDDISKYNQYVNNVRVFAINKQNIQSSIFSIIKSASIIKRSVHKVNCAQINAYLNSYLLKIGLNPKFTGFDYVKKSIMICANNHNFRLNCLQQSVFPRLAILYNKKTVNIERNIRSVIKDASKSTKFIQELKSHGLDASNITTRTFLSFLLNKCYNIYIDNFSLTDEDNQK